MDKNKYFEAVREYKLLAKHEVGQNFLCSLDVAQKIIETAEIKKDEKVLEIGSGAGSLSVFLTDYEAESTLVDIDEALVTKLQNDFAGYPNIHPYVQNALKMDISNFDVIVGNLPYYITSSLIEKILLEGRNCRKAVLMIQKEAFSRLTAKVGSEDYGPLQILLSYVGKAKREFNVSRDCFVPAPHVDSTVFTITFNPPVSFDEAAELYAFAEAMFLYRRKTIFNNLKYWLKDAEKAKEAILKANIDERSRPENLTLDDYLRLLAACK